jgi:hypothetical protein
MEWLVAFLVVVVFLAFISAALKRGLETLTRVFEGLAAGAKKRECATTQTTRCEYPAKQPLEIEIRVSFTRKEDAEAAQKLAQDVQAYLAQRSEKEMVGRWGVTEPGSMAGESSATYPPGRRRE